MSAPAADATAIAILVRRGDRVESWHRVSYTIADPAGDPRQVAGHPDRPIFPRSAIKPLQALVLLESGAAERFAVSDAELALACASHGGEPCHVDAIRSWLARLGLDQGALECGAHPPLHAPSAVRLATAGRQPEPIHNNCSGKHSAMLATALHLGAPLAGYSAADHPVQRRVAATLAEMAGADALPPPAVDGCGLPTWPLSLGQLATALARLADPTGMAADRRAACRRLCAAMSAHPKLVAGSGRACTAIMTVAPEVIVKTGAEGVYGVALPRLGLGIALKVEDGGGRAAPVALLALLEAVGALRPGQMTALEEVARPVLRNHAGRLVGRIEPAPGWPAF